MRSHTVLHLVRVAALAVFAMVMSSVALAQPPAIGPDSFKVDKTDIGAQTLRNFVRTQLDQVITNVNANLAAGGHGNIHVTRQGDVNFYAPLRLASTNPRTPNSYYVKVPMNFTLNLGIPGFDRQLYYPLDLNVSCSNWYLSGGGNLNVTAVVGPPDIQGGSIIENLLMVRDTIDNYIKSKLPTINSISTSLPGKCETIGASVGIEAQNSFVAWDAPGTRRIIIGRVMPHIEITYERLKRLAARGNGQLLYNAVETVQLDTYANYTERQAGGLTLHEGDVVDLHMPNVVIDSPLPNILVIIAGINQTGGSQDDSAFTTAQKTANFSPGEHTIQIPKTYVIPGGGPSHAKPSFGHTPAYELTYKVTYVNPDVLSPVTRVQ